MVNDIHDAKIEITHKSSNHQKILIYVILKNDNDF